jgi:DNA-nicking Smr family endonuclease
MRRRLGPDEKTLWGKVIATVKPLHGTHIDPVVKKAPPTPKPVRVEPSRDTLKARTTSRCLDDARHEPKKAMPSSNLDGHWDRRIHRGGIVPDISIDLHDASLSRAYARLDGALEQAIAQKLKVILLVTGKSRAHDRVGGEGRGAIASVVRDWLAASRHSRHISAVRNAHPKHGGAGALYIVLKS